MNKTFKKAISVLLIAVMVLCSAPLSGFVGLELPETGGLGKLADSASEFFGAFVSRAKAWTVNDDPNDISFTLKFFRESSASSGDWVETTKAAPGEKVKARIYIETGYYTYGGETALIFDRDFFTVSGLNSGVNAPLDVNTNYGGPADDAYGPGEYNLLACARWYETVDYNEWFNKWNLYYNMDYISEELENDVDFFRTHDFVIGNIEFGSNVNNCRLDDSDWMYEFELVVADNAVTNTINESGEAEVPPYYYSKDRYLTDEDGEFFEDVELPVNISKGEKGQYRNKNISMWEWLPEFTTTPGVISTTSEIIFDMGLVDENGAWYEDTYTMTDGIIGKEADLNAVTNPSHPDGLVFSHWSTQKPGEGVAQEEVSTIAYDYDATTLYAVWDEPADTTYYTVTFVADTDYDGEYETVVAEEEYVYGEKLHPEEAPENYPIDAWKLADGTAVVFSADDTAYTVTGDAVFYTVGPDEYPARFYWSEEDMENCEEPYTTVYVKYGEEITQPDDPQKPGYDFVGWTQEPYSGTPEFNLGVMDTYCKDFVAIWTESSYEIIFIDYVSPDGGPQEPIVGFEIARSEINYNGVIHLPDDPVFLDGKTYKFIGWFDVDGNEYKEGDIYKGTGDLVLHSRWEAKKFFIEFYDGDEWIDGGNQSFGEIIVTPDYIPQKTGYTFAGWVDRDGNPMPETVPAHDAEYYLRYEVSRYTAVYDAAGGVFADGTGFKMYHNIEYGAEVPVLETNPTREGYTFVRWTPEAPDAMPDNDLIFIAVWESVPEPEEQEYEIYISYLNPANPEEIIEKLVITDNALPGTTVEVIKAGEEKTADKAHSYEEILAKVTVNGIEPDYYNRPEAIEVTENGGKIAVPFKLTEYTVTFNPNSGKFGESTEPVTVTGTWGHKVEVPADPIKTGYTFVGWDNEVPETFSEDVVLNAIWEIQSHDAIFVVVDENGNEVVRIPVEYNYGETISAPSYLAPAGYEFNGWEIEPGTTMGEEDMIFDSKLEVIIRELTFDANGGEFENGETEFSAEGKPGTTVNVPEPSREGYEFAGWVDEKGNEYKTPNVIPEENTTIYAKWQKIVVGKSTITLDANGGEFSNGAPIWPIKSQIGDPFNAVPANPTREGYDFVGWTDVDGNPTTIPTVFPAEDVTIKAKWEPKEYTITFDSNGGSEVSSQTYKFGDEVIAPADPTREGFTFIKWNPELPATMPANNVRVKAVWETNKHSVTYDAGEGAFADEAGAPSKITYNNVAYGAEVPVPETNPTREGYTFVRWTPETPETMPALNIVFNAVYEINTYSVDWCIDGLVMNDSYKYGETIVKPKPFSKKGYTFVGWTPEIPETMPDYNLTFEAVWQVNTHTVFWDVDGVVTEVEYDYNEPIYPIDNPEKIGYTFVGWNPEVPAVMPDKDLVFTAEWELNKHNVTWIVDGSETVEEFYFGDEITAFGTPEKIGYTFIGWTPEIPETMPDCDLIFEAEWLINTHSVFWNVDGEITEMEYDYNEQIILPQNPEKEGYTFVGWGAEVPSVMPDNDLCFTAEWKLNKYNVTWIADGKDIVTEYYYAEEIIVPELPEKTGYTLVGWSPEVPAVMPASDLVFNAVYEANFYDAVFMTNGGVFSDGDSLKRISTEFDSAIASPGNVSREGYVFAGWAYNGNNIGDDFGVMDTVDGKLFEALWIIDASATYVVEYHMMNTVGEYDVTPMYFSAGVNQPVSVRPVAPAGFVLNEENSVLSGTVGSDNSLVLKVYIDRLSFNFNIVVDGVTETVSYYYGAMISEPAIPVKEGCEFVGWEGEIPETMPAEDITVTAVFKEKAEDKTYAKLTIAKPEKSTLYYGETITLYASVKNTPEGAKIKWYVEGDGVSIKPSANGKSCKVTSTSNGNVVIRAMVVDAKGNTIKGSDGKPIADYETIYSEVTFWQIIVSFFRNLFKGSDSASQAFRIIF